MSRNGNFWKAVQEKGKKDNPNPVQVGEIKSLAPFIILFQGVELSFQNGDTIFINSLILDENVNLDVSSMDSAQNITEMTPPPWISQGTSESTYTAKISGTQKQFLADFYNWAKSVHNRYILHIGDFVAVQKLGNNTYLILEKVQKIGQ